MKKLEQTIIFPQSSEIISIFFKTEMKVCEIAAFKFKLAVVGDNTGTSRLVTLVLSPRKYNSPVVLSSN